MINRITKQEVGAFLLSMGKKGERTLSVLGKEQDFIAAVSSPIGMEILHEFINRHEELMSRLPLPDVTQDEKAEYRVVRDYLLRVSARIRDYNMRVQAMREVANKSKKEDTL